MSSLARDKQMRKLTKLITDAINLKWITIFKEGLKKKLLRNNLQELESERGSVMYYKVTTLPSDVIEMLYMSNIPHKKFDFTIGRFEITVSLRRSCSLFPTLQVCF